MGNNCINWFFGRGLSIACGLKWSVPDALKRLDRDEQIKQIKFVLRQEMANPAIDTSVIDRLLRLLETRTSHSWCHRFLTTNWDYLLQKELLSQGWTVKPSWLSNTHVYHLNGTIEELPHSGNRSPFLLESDPPTARYSTYEANDAYNCIIWDRFFVVVGMSFECEMDKFLLQSLQLVEDDLPIGESQWLIINPDINAARTVSHRIQSALPQSNISIVSSGLIEWIEAGSAELINWGALS